MRCLPLLITVAVLLVAGSARGQSAAAPDPLTLANGWIMPRELDPEDKTERVLLFLPVRPVLIEFTLTIDEQPFRKPGEKLLEDLLSPADANKDGKLSWDEVLDCKKFSQGRFNFAQGDQRTQFIEQYDLDKDGIASRHEIRRLQSQFSAAGGAALTVQGRAFVGANIDGSQVYDLLDANRDQVITAEELKAAPERLRARDADDNEIVTLSEIAGDTSFAQLFNGGQATSASVLLVGLTDVNDNAEIYNMLLARYGKEQKVPATLFDKSLDGNGDGEISAAELSGLVTIPPHLAIDVALGTRSVLRDTAKVTHIAPELENDVHVSRDPTGKLSWDLFGAKIELIAPNPKPAATNTSGTIQVYMKNYDKDNNGYLSKTEVEAVAGIAMQFELWDENADGMVFPDELKAFLERSQAPQYQRITVAAMSQGSNLFDILDGNKNQQLSLREMLDAEAAVLKRRGAGDTVLESDLSLLKTASKEPITRSEFPVTIQLAVARGTETQQYLNRNARNTGMMRSPSPGTAANPAQGSIPAWFLRMDTNGDYDLTRREFLGDDEQFKRLDTQADGVISYSEAIAAEPKK